MPEAVVLSVFSFYALLVIAAVAGLMRRHESGSTDPIFVSVIVPARNEEGNIGACIESLLSQKYPVYLFEIIIVNDGSEDRTKQIVSEYQKIDSRIIVTDSRNDIALPPGKSCALESGIRLAKGDIILNTDADCIVPEDWISSLVSYYHNRVSMVNGVTLPEGRGWLSGVQTLDFAFLHGVAAGFSGIRVPLAGMGNNMSYKKDSYLKTGGFEKLGFSVTEDFQLTRAFLQQGEKVVHIASEGTSVRTLPVNDFGGLFSQKKRWAAGGLKSPPVFYLLFFAAWLASAGLFIAPFMLQGYCLLLPLLKFLADFLLLHNLLHKVKMRGVLRYFLPFELYLSVYVIIFPLILPFSKGITWKGRYFR
ncbi:MAG: glycosyltransferase [Ignavibacteriales bacterium]|nr:MAG: glycosyltransferase [Ignavibacteriales bacterium]